MGEILEDMVRKRRKALGRDAVSSLADLGGFLREQGVRDTGAVLFMREWEKGGLQWKKEDKKKTTFQNPKKKKGKDSSKGHGTQQANREAPVRGTRRHEF